MPNDCFNRVRLCADPDALAPLVALLKQDNPEQPLTMRGVVPEPEGLDTRPDDWYTWRCTHWGTKWDLYDVVITDDDAETFAFECSTAWAPPEPFVEALRECFPNVSVSWFYDEPCAEMAGYL